MSRRLLVIAVTGLGLLLGVGVVFALVVFGLGRPPSARERTILILAGVAAVVSAAAWSTLGLRVHALARRLVYGDLQTTDEVLRVFHERSTRSTPLGELLLELAESLREALRLAAVEIWTGSDGVLERTVSDPERGPARIELGRDELEVVTRASVSGPRWAEMWLGPPFAGRGENIHVTPVVRASRLLGVIVTEHTDETMVPVDRETALLTELARHVGQALDTVRLDAALQASLDEVRRTSEELRRSRARIVAAADAERRRIERDLHDGAQQRLISLAVKTRLAHELAADAGPRVREVLAELGGDIEGAIDELRQLAHGIYPPLLAERGLRSALLQATETTPCPVTVEVAGGRRYAAEVEAAVYFCCLEALQNVGKHAGADAAAHLSLREVEGALVFEVSDTGGGFEPDTSPRGSGLTHLADRLGAIGGRLHVSSRPGTGTSVTGAIPLDQSRSSAR